LDQVERSAVPEENRRHGMTRNPEEPSLREKSLLSAMEAASELKQVSE
jgi:hypothetical protein